MLRCDLRAQQDAGCLFAPAKDKKKILPCAAFLQGEYDIEGYYIGVPCKLGAAGLEKIIEIKLTHEEDAALKKSAAAVKELCAVIGV